MAVPTMFYPHLFGYPMFAIKLKGERGKEGKGTQQAKEPEQVRNEGKRERSGATTSPQAHKKRVPPPYCKEQAALPLITNSRQKISKKSPWGRFEKIFGKIFRGNVSGAKKNPLRYLNGRGSNK